MSRAVYCLPGRARLGAAPRLGEPSAARITPYCETIHSRIWWPNAPEHHYTGLRFSYPDDMLKLKIYWRSTQEPTSLVMPYQLDYDRQHSTLNCIWKLYIRFGTGSIPSLQRLCRTPTLLDEHSRHCRRKTLHGDVDCTVRAEKSTCNVLQASGGIA
jgi:hypothetical protein